MKITSKIFLVMVLISFSFLSAFADKNDESNNKEKEHTESTKKTKEKKKEEKKEEKLESKKEDSNGKKQIEKKSEEKRKEVTTYKQIYHWKLWDKIEEIAKKDPEKLKKLLNKINAMIKQFEKNTKLSEEDKNKIFSQLEAIKEIIQDGLK